MDARRRLEVHAREWGVVIEETRETPSSLIAYGRRGREPVVIKVVRGDGDESRAGEILEAFAGAGVVRVYEYTVGAMLLERLQPGTSLVDLVRAGRDEEATDVLAAVMRMMSPSHLPTAAPTVHDWSRGFERYVASGDSRVPGVLVRHAHRTYRDLCGSQAHVRLLHGDLHHENVLSDGRRGWLAIDPKGVVGEAAYELGAALRNPHGCLACVKDASVVRSRIARFAAALQLDPQRVLAWAFSQAVLSAIWSIEDDGVVAADDPSMLLSQTTYPMLVETDWRIATA